MRVAVVSDIHSNLHALEAVLAAIDADAPDELWCLGDLVGYGPRPNECCAVVRERADVCLAGNHDLAVRGTIDLAEFGGDAGIAAAWTRGVLEPEAKALLDRLSDEAAAATLALAQTPLVLVGHSHVALLVVSSGEELEGGPAPAGTEAELGGLRALLNPGSVGQPRDGDPRAAYLLLDLDAPRAEFRRVEYDVARTQQEMREADLPEFLTARLAAGQ
jgi:predicted phosphodiesterase